MVTSQTIINCCKHCGVEEIKGFEGDPFADIEGGGDPFADAEGSGDTSTDNGIEQCPSNIDDLVAQFHPSMTREDYLEADSDLSTSLTFNDLDHWRE